MTTQTDLPDLGTPSDAAPAAPVVTVRPTQDRRPGRQVRSLPVVRALLAQSLTGAGAVLVATTLIAPGVLVDLVTDATVGTPTTLSFLLAAVAAALVVRRRSLGTAAVLPPLLYAGAIATLAWLSGNNEGSRELVLDTGTTLALAAPVLFAGTASALLVILGRLAWSLLRR